MPETALHRRSDDELEGALLTLRDAIDWPPSVGRSATTAGTSDIATIVAMRLSAGVPPTGAPSLVADAAGVAAERGAWRTWWSTLRPARRALALALVALLALAVIAGAMEFGLPGLRFVFDGPRTTSPQPSIPIRQTPTPSPGGSGQASAPLIGTGPAPAPGPPGASLALGTPVSLGAIDWVAGFHVRWPSDPSLGAPQQAWVDPARSDQVTLAWVTHPDLGAEIAPGVGLLVSEFRGSVESAFFEKMIGAGTSVERVVVQGHGGWWLSGEPHEFFYTSPDGTFVDEGRRWVGDVLVWAVGDITYRVETGLARDDAIRLADTID